MANEIQVTVALQVTKGLLQHSQVPGTLLFDMSGTGAAGGAVSATTTATALDLAPLVATNLGYSYFRNTSSTGGETIQIGTGTGGGFVAVVELRPREVALFRVNSVASTVLTIKSGAGTPTLQYWIAQA
jgi:hypothetical protein